MRYLYFCLLVLFFAVSAHATSYLKLWVNGEVADTLVQGDNFAWEFDVSEPGGSAMYSIYYDLDNSRTVSEGDVKFDTFPMTDGEQGNGGPGDSSLVADGIVYAQLGPFGFAPGAYVMEVEENGSKLQTALFIKALANPGATISGTLTIEGVNAPDDFYSYIMVGAQTDEGFAGFWSGLTDVHGNYTINLPQTAVGQLWEVEFFFENQLSGYALSDEVGLVVAAGSNNGVDFYAAAANAVVKGALLTEQGDTIKTNVYARLYSDENESDFEVQQGVFEVPVVASANGSHYEMQFDDDGLQPAYMVPDSRSDSSLAFEVFSGDTLTRNVTLLATDAQIDVVVTMNGETANQSFFVSAHSDSLGYAQGLSNPQGHAVLSVKSGVRYNVYVSQDERDADPFPDGYVFEGSPWQDAFAGDTVYFNLVAASGAVYGEISFADQASADHFDRDRLQVEVYNQEYTKYYFGEIGPDNSYMAAVQDGEYYVEIDNWSEEFLGNPTRYSGVVVEGDTVGPVDFTINYRHATLEIRLKNAPDGAFWYDFYIYTEGGLYPNFYQTRAHTLQDSSFFFSVCDGTWKIEPPFGDKHYSVEVSDQDSFAYIEIDYNVSDIEQDAKIPATFKVAEPYPNPFNPFTTLAYDLPRAGQVTAEVFDITGRKVETLYNGHQYAGRHKLKWDAVHYSSGVYFFRLQAAGKVTLKKLILVK